MRGYRAWTGITAFAVGAIALPGPLSSSAWAIQEGKATLGFGISSYLASDTAGPVQVNPSIDLDLSLRLEGDSFGAEGSLVSRYYLTYDHPYAIEAPQVYGWGPGGISLGRKLHSWSQADEEWQLGLWQPRYRWDYLHPLEVGLTGAFAEVRTGPVRVMGFVSPVFIPERGAPVLEDRGALRSASPWFVSPVRVAEVDGVPTSVDYQLQIPPVREVVLHPGGAIQIRVGEEEGPWGLIGGAIKPENQLAFGVNGFYYHGDETLSTTVYPRVLSHDLVTIESGYKRGRWSLWGSFTYEHPILDQTPADWTAQEFTDARLWAAGAAVAFGAWAGIALSVMNVSGGNAPDRAGAVKVRGEGGASVFDPRYAFETALKLKGHTRLPGPWKNRLNASSQVLVDLAHLGDPVGGGLIWSAELTYADELRQGFAAVLGADLMASRTEGAPRPLSDFISRNRSNHQIHAGVSYAF